MDTYVQTSLIVLFLPLVSFVVLFFLGEKLPRRGDWVGVAATGAGLLLSLRIFAHFWGVNDPGHRIEANWRWAEIGSFHVDVGVLLDGMTAVMLMVVMIVSFLVHVFSVGYMHGDRRYARYFAFLGWFTFAMLGIVLSNNVFFLYIFWELVGLASYLLIGFFFHKNSAADANKKAFLTNRVGDFGFWMGILIFFAALGTFNYQELFAGVANGQISGTLLTWAGIGLFMGCVGKSAQVPLHVWLPDAMEGPTPVSALIHAATMVAAGVYMTARLFPLFDPTALLVIAYTGGITALFAATIAVVQTDIKKGLAYSTVSQLGYMVMAVGVGSVVAGMFHLTTHAMFKACLFLGSGSVIHAMHHHQEMTVMGGLRKKMPITFATFLIATIAISGVPPLAGFWSKDAILGAALAFGMLHPAHYAPFLLALVAAALTAFYMFRIVFMTFTGKPRDEELHEHAHESGFSMAMPLVVLAFLAVIAGGLPWAGLTWFDRFVAEPSDGAVEHALNTDAPADVLTLVAPATAAPQHESHDHAAEDTTSAAQAPPGTFVDDVTSPSGALEVPAMAKPVRETSHGEPGAAAHGAASPTVDEHGAGAAHDGHDVHHAAHERAMILSLIVAGLGILFSFLTYRFRVIDSRRVQEAMPDAHRVLWHKYYFDEFYRGVVWRGLLAWNKTLALFDNYVVDGAVNASGYLTRAAAWLSGMSDRYFVDGLVNATGDLLRTFGSVVSGLQTGRIQTYFLGLVSGLVILVLVYRAAWPS